MKLTLSLNTCGHKVARAGCPFLHFIICVWYSNSSVCRSSFAHQARLCTSPARYVSFMRRMARVTEVLLPFHCCVFIFFYHFPRLSSSVLFKVASAFFCRSVPWRSPPCHVCPHWRLNQKGFCHGLHNCIVVGPINYSILPEISLF